jgi:purine-binding chemotaxis protein CheW
MAGGKGSNYSHGGFNSDSEFGRLLPVDEGAMAELSNRASKLADPGDSSEEVSITLSLLKFIIAKEYYAIDIGCVTGCHPLTELTPIPCVPDFVKGILRVRGRIVSAIDLRQFFGLPPKGITDLKKVIIISNEQMEVGILADAALGVSAVALDDLQPSNGSLTAIDDIFLRGVTRERLIVINADSLLSHEALVVNDQVNL